MKIPIRNLYYLLVYAWDVLDQVGVGDIDVEQIETPPDLFAKILRNGIDHLLKRGLDRAYTSETGAIPGIRGRLNLSSSIKTASFTRGVAVCSYDELTYDVLHNQILKASLLRLIRTDSLSPELKQDLHDLVLRFDGISEIQLSNNTFRQVQLHSNNRYYRLLIQICWMLHQQLLPDTSGKGYRFADFSEDRLATIFESFVRNFFKREQRIYKVKRERFKWQRTSSNEQALQLLPTMETDVSLISPKRKIIIEVKFYEKTLAHHHFGGASIRSPHLYQLFAYLQNLNSNGTVPLDGVLIYPTTDHRITSEYQIFGHHVRIMTIDLTEEAKKIRSSLFECIAEPTNTKDA